MAQEDTLDKIFHVIGIPLEDLVDTDYEEPQLNSNVSLLICKPTEDPVIDLESRHKPPPKSPLDPNKRGKVGAGRPAGRKNKNNLRSSANLNSEDESGSDASWNSSISSNSSVTSNDGNYLKPTKTTANRKGGKRTVVKVPKNWPAMMQKVNLMQNYEFEFVSGTSCRVYNVKNPTGKVYHCQIPSPAGLFVCDCPDYLKKSKYAATKVTKNCKHIVALLLKMGVPKQNMLLYNTVLNESLKESVGQYKLPVSRTSTSQAPGTVVENTAGPSGYKPPTGSLVQHEYHSFREAKLAIDRVRCKYSFNIYPKGRGRASLCGGKHKISLTKLQPCVCLLYTSDAADE